MKRLLYALMLNSGNDAATAIAEHIDGTKEQFARRMNEFLKSKVGVTNTNFINPSGLPDPKHVTTARDMAQIARYAMQNSTFRAIVSTRKMPWKGKEWDSNLINHNKLIGSYEGTTGIKNGYTDEAKSTLVASAKRNGMEIVGVVLKSKTGTDLYQDITELLDYGFQNFERKSIFVSNQTVMLGTGDSEKEYIARKPISTVVPIGSSPFHWVNSNGDVVLQTPLGQQTIGKLEAVPGKSTQPAIDKFVAVPSRSTYDYIVFALWLMLNIFLGLIGGLTIQRKIRSVREQRRAENWTN
jgi:D-alanyl-D-alanine carboxypeptidase